MATQLKVGRSFVDKLIVDHMAGKNIVTGVSMAKWWATDLAQKVAVE